MPYIFKNFIINKNSSTIDKNIIRYYNKSKTTPFWQLIDFLKNEDLFYLKINDKSPVDYAFEIIFMKFFTPNLNDCNVTEFINLLFESSYFYNMLPEQRTFSHIESYQTPIENFLLLFRHTYLIGVPENYRNMIELKILMKIKELFSLEIKKINKNTGKHILSLSPSFFILNEID